MRGAGAASSASRRRRSRPIGPASQISPIAPRCVTPRPVTLVFQERRGTARDVEKVHDAAGRAVFEVEARALRNVATGGVLGQVRRSNGPREFETWYLGTPADREKCAVKCLSTDAARCGAEICLGSAAIGDVRGDWRARAFAVTVCGRVVAQASRGETDKPAYRVEVAAGVDAAFIALIVVALDEIYRKYC